jgi:hypothetical protein
MRETKLQWRDIVGTPHPEAFNRRDLDKYFHIDLQQFHDSIEEAIKRQTEVNAGSRASDILERRGAITRHPSYSEQKRGSGPNMLDGQVADALFTPSETGSTTPPPKKIKKA